MELPNVPTIRILLAAARADVYGVIETDPGSAKDQRQNQDRKKREIGDNGRCRP